MAHLDGAFLEYILKTCQREEGARRLNPFSSAKMQDRGHNSHKENAFIISILQFCASSIPT